MGKPSITQSPCKLKSKRECAPSRRRYPMTRGYSVAAFARMRARMRFRDASATVFLATTPAFWRMRARMRFRDALAAVFLAKARAFWRTRLHESRSRIRQNAGTHAFQRCFSGCLLGNNTRVLANAATRSTHRLLRGRIRQNAGTQAFGAASATVIEPLECWRGRGISFAASQIRDAGALFLSSYPCLTSR